MESDRKWSYRNKKEEDSKIKTLYARMKNIWRILMKEWHDKTLETASYSFNTIYN